MTASSRPHAASLTQKEKKKKDTPKKTKACRKQVLCLLLVWGVWYVHK
jgi:hypothetical protein